MFSNAQEVHIISSSNVNFYTILSYVLDSDSEILKMIFFFQNFTPFKGLFFKKHFRGNMIPQTPLVLLGYRLRAPLLQINLGETLCSNNF